MPWFTIGLTTAMLLPAVLLYALLRRLRRAGLGDRTGERVLMFWILYVLARAVLLEVWPGEPPMLLKVGSVVPLLLVSFGLAAVRIHQRPDILFDPTTIARAREILGRIRPGS